MGAHEVAMRPTSAQSQQQSRPPLRLPSCPNQHSLSVRRRERQLQRWKQQQLEDGRVVTALARQAALATRRAPCSALAAAMGWTNES